jgi:hypothetical protein
MDMAEVCLVLLEATVGSTVEVEVTLRKAALTTALLAPRTLHQFGRLLALARLQLLERPQIDRQQWQALPPNGRHEPPPAGPCASNAPPATTAQPQLGNFHSRLLQRAARAVFAVSALTGAGEALCEVGLSGRPTHMFAAALADSHVLDHMAAMVLTLCRLSPSADGSNGGLPATALM